MANGPARLTPVDLMSYHRGWIQTVQTFTMGAMTRTTGKRRACLSGTLQLDTNQAATCLMQTCSSDTSS